MKKIITICFMLLLLAVALTGCQKSVDVTVTAVSKTESLTKLNAYLASIKEKSDAIRSSLENDALTQSDMNQKAQELDELWAAALTHVLSEAKNILSEDEWTKLAAEQNAWMEEKEKAVQTAGKEFEGGSLYPLTVSMESARITEERVDALCRILM